MKYTIKYRIKDMTQCKGARIYLAGGEAFSKDEAREQLIAFHSIDWRSNGNDRDINTISLSEIMDYGQWALEPVKYDKKGREIQNA